MPSYWTLSGSARSLSAIIFKLQRIVLPMQKEERRKPSRRRRVVSIAVRALLSLFLVLLTIAEPSLALITVPLLLFTTGIIRVERRWKAEEVPATVERLRAKLPERPSSVPLNPGEVIVLRDVAVTVRYIRLPRSEREYFEVDWEKVHEFVNVYLSNERLIADVIPPLSIPLEKIEGCTVAKEIPLFTTTVAGIVQTVKRKAFVGELLYIYADVEGPWKHFVFELLDARRWRDEVERLRAKRVEELRRRERPVIVDFSALRDILERGGISTFVPRCPNCGAPIQLPESGESVKCPYCGATIYAKDILERLKELMSKLA
jgi:DNA-directed RNA polymerase subunit RPC12/RpoP